MPTLTVRNVSASAVRRIDRAAHARGWTVGEYLARLVALHEEVRRFTDAPTSDCRCDEIRAVIRALGLATLET